VPSIERCLTPGFETISAKTRSKPRSRGLLRPWRNFSTGSRAHAIAYEARQCPWRQWFLEENPMARIYREACSTVCAWTKCLSRTVAIDDPDLPSRRPKVNKIEDYGF
jgi:hypothetical protein